MKNSRNLLSGHDHADYLRPGHAILVAKRANERAKPVVSYLEKLPAPDSLKEKPKQINLKQNYPNPFNPTTTIPFHLMRAQHVTLTIYDILGREVEQLLDHRLLSAGRHQVRFDAGKLSSGTYIYRLETEQGSYQHALTLIK